MYQIPIALFSVLFSTDSKDKSCKCLTSFNVKDKKSCPCAKLITHYVSMGE
jgi:hypothetical protein